MAEGRDEWLDAEAVARCLGLPERTVRRLIARRQLEASGPPWRVRRRHLDAFIEQSRLPPSSMTFLDATKPPRAATQRVNRDGTPDRRFGPRYG